jgi:gliding motility-associated lipoprotein GldH
MKIRKNKYKVFDKSIKSILLIMIVSSNLSCNSRTIYNEKYIFEDFNWSKDEKIAFHPDIEIKNVGTQYQGVIHIRYITGFSYKYLNFKLSITSPKGSQSTKEISIQMLTDDKEYRGDGMGDIWDIDYKMAEPITFHESGKYQIEIISMMGEQPVNFINEIGFGISKF